MSRGWMGVRHLLLALQFFTRIPITGRLAAWVGYSPAMLRASAGHWPAVGVVVGVLTATLAGVLLAVLPDQPAAAWVAAALATALGVWITGAFHEDGLADLADGLGGSLNRERALEIMKDSRVGSFGALALALALLTRVALLALIAQVQPWALPWALVCGHTVSRTWPLLTIASLTHVGDAAGSKSKPLADQIDRATLVTGWLWCLGLLALVWQAQSASVFVAMTGVVDEAGAWVGVVTASTLGAAMAAAGLAWWWMRRLLQRRLQGFTGDGLGASQQVVELAFYLGWVVAW